MNPLKCFLKLGKSYVYDALFLKSYFVISVCTLFVLVSQFPILLYDIFKAREENQECSSYGPCRRCYTRIQKGEE